MVPWQLAVGLTITVTAMAAVMLPEWLPYLKGYWRGILGWGFAAPLLTAMATLCAGIFVVARKAGLGDLGRKVEHIDRRLVQGDAAHDPELAAALQRDRSAQWGSGGRQG